jgi:hypothetical protein
MRKALQVKRSTRHRVPPDTTRHCPQCVERDRWWVTLLGDQCPRCGTTYNKKAPVAQR